MAKCPSRANFDTSHDWFAKIFNFGPILGPFEAKGVLLGGPGGPEEARYQVNVPFNHDSSPVIPIGGSWDQSWTLRALQVPLEPPKGPFGAKMSPRGALKTPEWANMTYNNVLYM